MTLSQAMKRAADTERQYHAWKQEKGRSLARGDWDAQGESKYKRAQIDMENAKQDLVFIQSQTKKFLIL